MRRPAAASAAREARRRSSWSYLLVALVGVTAIAAGDGPPADSRARDVSGLQKKPFEAKLESLEGGRLRLSEFRGKPVLLELWASWCLPCQEQTQVLRDLAGELSSRGIVVLAVDQGEEEKTVREFLAQHPSDFPVVLDRLQVVSGKLEVGELPALVLLDRQGTIVGLRVGVTRRAELLALLAAGETHPG